MLTLLKLLSKDPKNKVKKKVEEDKQSVSSVFMEDFYSAALKRFIKLEVVLPPWYNETPLHTFPLLLMNDGQSLHQIKVKEALTDLYLSNSIPPIIVVGIHAKNRMNEYGVAGFPDYKNRGDRAANYSRFIVNELLGDVVPNSLHTTRICVGVGVGVADCSLCGINLIPHLLVS